MILLLNSLIKEKTDPDLPPPLFFNRLSFRALARNLLNLSNRRIIKNFLKLTAMPLTLSLQTGWGRLNILLRLLA